VLTGETGAGKSLLIDALGLALGARADTTLVRHGAESRARGGPLRPDPGAAHRRPRGPVGGRSTARLDDETVTAAASRTEVGPLVEIHGQHDQQRLLDERWQRDLLDAYGGHDAERAGSAAAVEALAGEPGRSWPCRSTRASSSVGSSSWSTRRPRSRPPGSDRARPRDPGRLAAAQHGEAIARGSAALAGLSTARGRRGGTRAGARAPGGRETGPPRSALRAARRLGSPASRPSSRMSPSRHGASRRISITTRRALSPARGATLRPLRPRAPVRHRRGCRRRARRARGRRGGAAAGPRGERAAGAEDARLLGGVAEAARPCPPPGEAAAALAGAVDGVLAELGFPHGVFEVAVGRRPAGPDEPAVEIDGDAVAFDATGRRPGRLPARPEPRRAGPAARPDRLRRRAVARRPRDQAGPRRGRRDTRPSSSTRSMPGSGGGAPIRSGGVCGALARRHQVLCVTHLPQIAAHADAHFRIAKRERDGRTVTEVERLDREGRIVELAQMLGGRPGGAGCARIGTRTPRPRRGLARRVAGGRLSAPDGPPGDGTTTDLERTIEDYPEYLRVERGVSEATIRAYRGDLPTSPASRGVTRSWRRSADAAIGYLAARTRGAAGRRGTRPDEPATPRGVAQGLLPVRLRRGPHREWTWRPPRAAAPAAPPAGDAHRRRDVSASSMRRATTIRTSPTTRAAPCTSARRAPLRGRPPDQRGPPARSRGSLARRRVRPGHRQGRPGAARACRRRRARLASALDRRSAGCPARRSTASIRPGVGRSSSAIAGGGSHVSRPGRRSRRRPGGRDSGAGSARTRSATRSRHTCSRAERTCGSSRSCSDMRVSRRPSSTRT
jgi:DNA repair protein RecN (Recombination protein N)